MSFFFLQHKTRKFDECRLLGGKWMETLAMFPSKNANLTYAQNWYIALKDYFHPMCSREQNRHFLGN